MVSACSSWVRFSASSRLHRLQAQRGLRRGCLVPGAEVGGGAGAQLALLGLELAHLAHQPFGQTGVGGEPLVVTGDLLAQVFLLQLEQGLRVTLLEARDEHGQKAADEIGDALEHEHSPCGRWTGALRSVVTLRSPGPGFHAAAGCHAGHTGQGRHDLDVRQALP
ncbi:MAG: hypothetical protein KatS3mg126_2470 [Lysobacteraceae bacterium]|nr:MAG: hypothetical protein KatS3mg126_2470 [Xanthomonadaceae bacterium]